MKKKNSFFSLCIFLICFLSASPAWSQKTVEKVSLPRCFSFDLTSRINGQQYKLFVSLPKSYKEHDTVHYKVLYVLDGNPFFPMMHSIQDFLFLGEEVPEMIIVGIGYPVHGLLQTMDKRTFDYTPTRDNSFDTMLTRNLHMPIVSGGANRFLSTLKNEIIPAVEKKYRVSNDRTVAGHSFGALFGAYVLFHEPELFNRYLLSSISFPWDGQEVLREEESFHKNGARKINAKLFVSVGSREPPEMVMPMKQLVHTLREHGYSGLEIEERVFEDESHSSVAATAFNHGLRYLYQGMVKRTF